MSARSRRHGLGVTLVELVVVIVLTAILLSMMGYFVVPIFQYSDARRRAEMTDLADTALRRMGRDLRSALPNSVRVSADGHYVEMLLVRTGGRYRADTGSSGGTACPTNTGSDPDSLDITVADTCFKSIGNISNASSVTNTDFLVVYNLEPGTTDADAYASANVTGGNKAQISSLTTEANQEKIIFSSNIFRFASPASRFQIIEGPVTYACSPNSTDPASGTLRRYSGYPITASQNTPPVGGSSALLVSNVSACAFSYQSNAVALSSGLVSLALTLGSKDLKGATETVSLYQAVHVSNVP
jgi:MSHA biogenesis protein MshO